MTTRLLYRFIFFLLFTFLSISFLKAQIVATVSSTEARCGNNGTIQVRVTVGVPPFNYQVFQGPTPAQGSSPNSNFTINGLAAGFYRLRLTDAAGLTRTDTVTVKGDYVPLNIISCDTAGSKVTVRAENGRKKYTYAISSDDGNTFVTPQDTNVFDCLANGTYAFRVTDSCGNFFTRKRITVNVKAPEMVGSCQKNVLNNSVTDVTLTVSFGEAPYTFECITSGNDTFRNNTGRFRALQGCFFFGTVIDRCGRRTTQQRISCSDLSIELADCVSFQQGTARLKALGGNPPYVFRELNSPRMNSDGIFTDLDTSLQIYNFEVMDSCGNRTEGSIKRLTATSVNFFNCPFDGRLSVTIFQQTSGFFNFENPEPWDVTCLNCHTMPTSVKDTVGRESIMSAGFDSIRFGIYNFFATNGCRDTIFFPLSVQDQLFLGAESTTCNTICTAVRCLDGAEADPVEIGASFQIIDKLTGIIVQQGSQKCYGDLETNHDYTVKLRLSNGSEQSKDVRTRNAHQGRFSLSATTATDTITGKCRNQYILTLDSVSYTQVLRFSDRQAMNPLPNNNRSFLLAPDKYLINSICNSLDTIELPDIQFQYAIETESTCPGNVTIQAKGGYQASDWANVNFKTDTSRLNLKFKDDIYRLYDTNKNLLETNTSGLFSNLKEQQTYYVGFLHENTPTACEVEQKGFQSDFYVRPELSSAYGAICTAGQNGELTTTVNGGTAPFVFQITSPSGYAPISTRDTFAVFSNLPEGTYKIQLSDHCGISADFEATVGQFNFTPQFTRDCSGFLTLDVPEIVGATYKWFNGKNDSIGEGNRIINTDTVGQTYTVEVRTNNCTYRPTVTVPDYSPNQTIAIAGEDKGVNADRTNLNANDPPSNGEGFWRQIFPSSGKTTFANNKDPKTGIQIDRFPGAYTYVWEVQDFEHNCTSADTVVYTFCPEIRQFFVSVSTTNAQCVGDLGTATATVTGAFTPLHYLWSNGDTTPTARNLPKGIYKVKVSDEFFCSPDVEKTFRIVQDTIVGAMRAVSTSCFGSSDGEALVNIQSDNRPFNYSWSNGEIGDKIDSLRAGNYSVTVTDKSGCEYMDTIEVRQPQQITFDQKATICFRDSFRVGNRYYNQTGNYSDTLTSRIGCDSIVLTDLTVQQQLFRSQRLSICEGDSIRVGSSIYKMTGQYRDTVANVTKCDTVIDTDLTVLKAYTVNVQIDTCFGTQVRVGRGLYDRTGHYIQRYPLPNGCDSTIILDLNIRPRIEVDILPNIVKMQFGDTVQLQTIVADSTQKIQYDWALSEYLSCKNCPHPILTGIKENTLLNLKLTDDKGCTTTKNIQILLTEKENPVFAPNSFTPNGDGQNDKFTIYSNQYVSYVRTFQIFNRWGEQVFVSQKMATSEEVNGWDGTYRGATLPAGVYVFWAELELYDGSSQIVKGEVNLIR